ncbi:alpha/beta hydrolase [Fictibacillus barbaricus]|uniref:Alpha/beta hydrolase n=1 Tax=Fictibacillus barbaricus TaxID=182136 RepID=A0ABU1TW88_9BACL|nr:alpha/beta hydrolase [Fictibacillus barbaricus]MDR7071439.1 hypothetical protein [Fictibacillus barbaricus]
MINIRSGHIIGSKEIKVPYNILSIAEKPKGLAILLPGVGYTVQAPVLHYSTGVFLRKDYDVLHVNYQYAKEDYDAFSNEELVEFVKRDVPKVMEEVLKHSTYDSFYLIAKSFGNYAIENLLKNEDLKEAKVIWLTPLLVKEAVFQFMMNSLHKGLCIIGDNDWAYEAELLNQLKQNENIEFFVLPDVNHSLEYDHSVIESVDVLKTVTEKINQF